MDRKSYRETVSYIECFHKYLFIYFDGNRRQSYSLHQMKYFARRGIFFQTILCICSICIRLHLHNYIRPLQFVADPGILGTNYVNWKKKINLIDGSQGLAVISKSGHLSMLKDMRLL